MWCLQSGMVAAEAIFDMLTSDESEDATGKEPLAYQTALENSWVRQKANTLRQKARRA